MSVGFLLIVVVEVAVEVAVTVDCDRRGKRLDGGYSVLVGTCDDDNVCPCCWSLVVAVAVAVAVAVGGGNVVVVDSWWCCCSLSCSCAAVTME